MEEFGTRKYREGDEAEINRLFNEVFGASRSLDEWYWKFRDNPADLELIAVAESKGAIVGHYGSVVVLFRYLSNVVPAAMPVDNFVIPEFRGEMQGVQKALFDFQDHFWNPIWFGFGFPNKPAYVVGKRILKYKDVGKIAVLFKRLNIRLAVRGRFPWVPSFLLETVRSLSNAWFRMLVCASASRADAGVITRVVGHFDERVDALWDRVKDRYKVICVRDRRYLDWRFRKPGTEYRITLAEKDGLLVGYAVTSVRPGIHATEGRIVDLLTDGSPGVASVLIRRSLIELISQKADYALCWRVSDKEVSGALEEAGFGEKEEVFPPVKQVFGFKDPERADEAVLGDGSNWYVTMADSDTC